MRRGRTVIFVVLIILIVVSLAAVGLLYFWVQAQANTAKGSATPPPGGGGKAEPTSTPVPTLSSEFWILRAAQPVARGDIIPTEAVQAIPVPTNLVPYAAVPFTETGKVVGSYARVAFAQGDLILSTLVLTAPWGSDAAVKIPKGKVAISLPYDANNGVAGGIKDGDHISLIVSWRIVNLDQTWQSALPNNVVPLIIPKEGGAPGETTSIGVAGPLGRMTPVPGGTGANTSYYVVPSETMQRFRLVTQFMVKDAVVLHIGQFGPNEPMTLTPTDTPVPPNATPGTPAPAVPPTATPAAPRILTLVVDPKDALAINYINRMAEKYPDAVQLTLVLHSVKDPVEIGAGLPSVSEQYMYNEFAIDIPTPLEYGVWGTPVAPTPVPPQP